MLYSKANSNIVHVAESSSKYAISGDSIKWISGKSIFRNIGKFGMFAQNIVNAMKGPPTTMICDNNQNTLFLKSVFIKSTKLVS